MKEPAEGSDLLHRALKTLEKAKTRLEAGESVATLGIGATYGPENAGVPEGFKQLDRWGFSLAYIPQVGYIYYFVEYLE